MGLYYKAEFAWERDDHGSQDEGRRITSCLEVRKVSWKKGQPRCVKKENKCWKGIPTGGRDTAKNMALDKC